MLACRPMIPLALAVAAGALAGRFFPFLSGCALPGLILSAGVLALFLLRPEATPGGARSEKTPPQYLPHILPVPGRIARRGRNAFFLILCAGCFFLAVLRQDAWRERLDPSRLPVNRWMDATLVADAPNTRQNRTGRGGDWRVPARVVSLGGAPAGGFPVRLFGTAGEAFRRGDRLKARIRLSLPRPPAFPHAFDSAFWLERDGLAAYAAIARGGENRFEILPEDAPSLFTRARRVLDAVRAAALTHTLARGGAYGPLLAAMLYGYRAELPAALTDAFRRAGIGHVLAISGLHVGLVIALLWWLSGRLPLSVRGRALACLAAAVVYLGLSGGQVAAARATLMAVVHLAAIACGRRGDMLNSLAAAAFLIILANPTAPLDISFQLSFTAIVFIYIALGGRRPDPAPGRGWRRGGAPFPLLRRLRAGLLSLAALSAATWIGLYPISAFVFRQVNLVALPINIAVIPMMGAVLVGGLLLPVLGWIPGAAFCLTLPSRALTRTAFAADALPYASVPVHSPPGWCMAVFYISVLLYLLNRLAPAGAARRAWLAVCCAGVCLGFAGTTAGLRSLPPPAEPRLSLLAGGALGVVAAETPDGRIALVGQIRRQGMDEAVWLHHLRRTGPVSVVTLGRGRRDTLEGLAFHCAPVSLTNHPLTRKRDANAPPAWIPVPEMPGAAYALVRDGGGRVAALFVRAGNGMIATASRLDAAGAAAVSEFLKRNSPPGQSTYLCLGYAWEEAAAEGDFSPAGWIGVKGGSAAALPAGWFAQSASGAVVLDGGLRQYAGGAWRGIPRRASSPAAPPGGAPTNSQ